MDVTVVCEDRYRDYIMDTFMKHRNDKWTLSAFGAWQGEKYAASDDERTSYKGIPIRRLTNLKKDEKILVAGINTGYLSQIMRALHDCGIDKYYAVRWFAIHSKTDFLTYSMGTEYSVISIDLSDGGACLGEIQVHATDSCNLNCKACTHFSPFVKGRRQINMTQFEHDMHRLRELFSSLYVFQLMGGEPLLEPEICMEMIQIVRSYYPECSINLITNGMLIDKMEDKFWSVLRNNGVTIRVSVYPLVVPKVERIKQILRQQGIDFICEISNKVEFEKCFTIKSKSNAYENMRRCHDRGCYSLYQGRITKCPSAMYARDLAAELKNGHEWRMVVC